MTLMRRGRRHRSTALRHRLVVAPENEGIFHWVRVVIAARSGDIETQPLIQPESTAVSRANLEGRAPRPQSARLIEDMAHERRSVAVAPILGPEGEVIDVDLVEHEPECAESCNAALRGANDVDVADTSVLQLP